MSELRHMMPLLGFQFQTNPVGNVFRSPNAIEFVLLTLGTGSRLEWRAHSRRQLNLQEHSIDVTPCAAIKSN